MRLVILSKWTDSFLPSRFKTYIDMVKVKFVSFVGE
jgi:FMN-dependent NADH-azoreductase